MADLYLSGMAETAARKWLRIAGGEDGITLFDLLGLAEGDVAPEGLPERVAKQLARLDAVKRQSLATGRQDYAGLADQLADTVRAAAALIDDPSQHKAHRDALLDARRTIFERFVAPGVTPGRKPTEAEMASFLQTAQQYRLGAADSRRIVNRLSGTEAGEARYAAFGVLYVADDPAQENHFDLLCIDESVTNPSLIRAQKEVQLKRSRETGEKSTRMEVKRAAQEFAAKVEEAGRVLLSPADRGAYLQQIRGLRRAKFREQLASMYRSGDTVKPDAIVRLLAAGRRMRLSESDTRQTITDVTGFSDYMSLLSDRKTPVLGTLEPLKFDLRSPSETDACRAVLCVRNEGAETLTGTAVTMADWISISPQEFQTASEQPLTIEVRPGRLPRGIPTAGQISIESNGGSQIVAVEAFMAGGDRPGNTKERILGGLIYLTSITVIVPLVCVFVFQRRSRFLCFQAAQASVLGVVAWGALVFGGLLGGFCCIATIIAKPVTYLWYAILISGVICAILCLAGRPVRIPVVAEYAERFV